VSERRKHLEFLRKTAREALWAGDYERALTLYEDGLALARAWKDRDLEDLFTCNRATTLIEMDRRDFDLSRLKEIVLRSPKAVTTYKRRESTDPSFLDLSVDQVFEAVQRRLGALS